MYILSIIQFWKLRLSSGISKKVWHSDCIVIVVHKKQKNRAGDLKNDTSKIQTGKRTLSYRKKTEEVLFGF